MWPCPPRCVPPAPQLSPPGGAGGVPSHPEPPQQGPGESEYSEPFEGEQEPAPEGCDEEATGGGHPPDAGDTPHRWVTPPGWAGTARGGPRAARAASPAMTSALPTSTTSPGSGRRITSLGRSQVTASPGATRSSRGPPRPGCPPSPRHVDTSLPLEKQAWYHGPIGRAGAETLLALCREGSFLVRDCETSPEDYSLSLRGHYTARALPVRGARHLSLLYPVAVQPL
ncbi:PREDICTED: SH2 domain-containing adapter protein D [Ficedula albicollis]|uniref:SH2 domain-containing adapter protein D n=1 Tax=Ficedula albicollis TaxID=59894 RepID=UPI0007AD9548|nr:PREDICTED: SH2 domain-containing adapter protein D [Ficedula albicollis]